LELATMFAHCRLQPRHAQLALRSAMELHHKKNNHASAADFARRLLEFRPVAKVAQPVAFFNCA
jgi:coatomer protein complex subunit alpha (xenin)